MRGRGFVLAFGLACAGSAVAQPADGRWSAEERCAGRATGRTYILTVDGRGLTARLAGQNLQSFGSILGATVLLPNDTFLIDIPVTGADSKVTYTGRLRPMEGRGSADGGLWEGSRHSTCTLSIARLGAGGGGKPTIAGRPEPIPRQGGAPSTLGPDGVWRRPDGGADISAPARRPQPPDAQVGRIDQAPPSTPVARPAPPPPPPPVAATPPAASTEVEALRRQLEEERRRRAMAESAMRLQEELRRQGGAAPAQ